MDKVLLVLLEPISEFAQRTWVESRKQVSERPDDQQLPGQGAAQIVVRPLIDVRTLNEGRVYVVQRTLIIL